MSHPPPSAREPKVFKNSSSPPPLHDPSFTSLPPTLLEEGQLLLSRTSVAPTLPTKSPKMSFLNETRNLFAMAVTSESARLVRCETSAQHVASQAVHLTPLNPNRDTYSPQTRLQDRRPHIRIHRVARFRNSIPPPTGGGHVRPHPRFSTTTAD